MKNYIIYRILNIINNKIYIGRTTQPLEKRMSVHIAYSKYKYKSCGCTYLQNSMRKYGYKNFEIREIDRAKNFQHLVFLEGFYIKYYQSNNPKYGYNLVIDSYGDGLEFISNDTKEKLSKSIHFSKYSNTIRYDNKRKKWILSISKGDIRIMKRFSNLNEYKMTFDKLLLYLYNDEKNLFFPEKLDEYKLLDLNDFYIKLTYKKPFKNKYYGVCFNRGYYICKLSINKKRICVGTYKDEKYAATLVDKVNFYLNGDSFKKFNFPNEINDNYYNEGKEIYNLSTKNNRRYGLFRKVSSKYLGVSKNGNGWQYEIKVNKKRFRGFNKSEDEAAKERDRIAVKFWGKNAKTNFPIENYQLIS